MHYVTSTDYVLTRFQDNVLFVMRWLLCIDKIVIECRICTFVVHERMGELAGFDGILLVDYMYVIGYSFVSMTE